MPDDDIVSEIQSRYSEAEAASSQWRSRAKDDLAFFYGDSYNNSQWSDAMYQARSGAFGGSPRPCLTINKVAQHVYQVENDARQNQMGVKVNATGFGAHDIAAEALEGCMRHIESQSNAQQNAYMCAIQGQVRIGLGWVHITTDYLPGVDSFDQDFFIRSVPDPLSVYFDPLAREPDHSDASWAMIVEQMDRSVFARDYPDAEATNASPLSSMVAHDQSWISKDSVRIATYYSRSERKDTLWATPDGPMRESAMTDEQVELCRQAKVQHREITSNVVEKVVIAGNAVIDRGETVFDLIPLVPFVGVERRDGGLHAGDFMGLVRSLIDAQRMFNYSNSAAVESVALQTKAPWLAAAESIEGYEDIWGGANTSNAAYLTYNAFDRETAVALPVPTRLDPPSASPGHFQIAQSADMWMQAVTGQYQAEMGAPSNERSGVAIQQRQRQSDTANYHFTDNQGMAIRYIGRLIIPAISKVYDTTRAIQILGLDGEMQQAVIDPNAQQSAQVALPNNQTAPAGMPLDKQRDLQGAILAINPTIGRFDVESDVGPAFATRRQEAFNALTQIIQADPTLMPRIGDLVFQSADFPMADVIADRLKPTSEDPQAAALQQQLQQANAMIGQLQQQLKSKQTDQHIKMAQLNHDKVSDVMSEETDRYKAETDRMSAIGSIDPAAFMPLIRQLVQEAMGSNRPPPADGGAPADVPPVRPMPNLNPPGGPIRDDVPSNGDVQ